MVSFKIHPGIGIARLGNADSFYIAPEQPGALPIRCDAAGIEAKAEDGSGTTFNRSSSEAEISFADSGRSEMHFSNRSMSRVMGSCSSPNSFLIALSCSFKKNSR